MKRQIEVFVAGCPLCDDAVATVQETVCGDCEVTIHSMQNAGAVERAAGYGIHAVPAVVVDRKLAECCSCGPVRADSLKAAGVGQPLQR